jgi:hypothetical protein
MRWLALVLLSGCATVPKRIQRDTVTYAAEIQSALLRQEAAARVLFRLADDAREGGDVAACVAIVTPALAIDQHARLQASRALWLAGLPYPDGNPPVLPAFGVEQEDPVEAWTVAEVSAEDWCGGDVHE